MRALVRKRQNYAIPLGEYLEIRRVFSSAAIVPTDTLITQDGAHDTIDQSQDLGQLSSSQRLIYSGSVGQNGLQVNWLQFEIDQPSHVNLNAPGVVVGLYNNAQQDFADQSQPNGSRLLAQNADGSLDRDLAAGTYFVAVSGIGNKYFNPLLADSGIAGRETAFDLTVTSTPLNIPTDTNPISLAFDATPLDVRVDLSSALSFDPTIELLDSKGNSLALQWTNYNSDMNELQMAPNVALSNGNYSVVVTDDQGMTQISVPFHFTRQPGFPQNAHDTPATATNLGTLGSGQLLQTPGMIGDDLYYDAGSFDPLQSPGNQVNFYHFQVTGNTRQALVAEVFAQRIGSPLDAGVSLYRRDDSSGQIEFVAGNNNTYNSVTTTTGQTPLYFDPVVMAGLTAGDYYVAVSQGFNTPAPDEGQDSGPDSGIFDPVASHSGSAGWGDGSYVLNLKLAPVPNAPTVTSTSITSGSTLTVSPDQIQVNFSEYVNLTNLVSEAYQQTSQTTVSAVYIQNTADGVKYFPRLTDFDPAGNTATFQMLDRLPAGNYQLHLSGSQGIKDIAGDPLTGSTIGGDFVVSFGVGQVSGQTNSNPLIHSHLPETDSLENPQSLETLFPRELQTGVQIVRSAGTGATAEHDSADYYQVHLLQDQSYVFTLGGNSLPSSVKLHLYDDQQNVIRTVSQNGGRTLIARLTAGDYVIRVGDWTANGAGSIAYKVTAKLVGEADNAPPLFSGPAPAVSIRLASAVEPVSTPTAPDTPAAGPAAPHSTDSTTVPSQTSSTVTPVIPVVQTTVTNPVQVTLASSSNTSARSTGSNQASTPTDRQGPPRIVFPGTDSNGMIVAASRSTSDGAFSVARNIRVVGTAREEGMWGSRLSDLADSSIGHRGAQTDQAVQSGKIRGLMEKLSRRIASEQSTNANGSSRTAEFVGNDRSTVSLKYQTEIESNASKTVSSQNQAAIAQRQVPGSVADDSQNGSEAAIEQLSVTTGVATPDDNQFQKPLFNALVGLATAGMMLLMLKPADAKRVLGRLAAEPRTRRSLRFASIFLLRILGS